MKKRVLIICLIPVLVALAIYITKCCSSISECSNPPEPAVTTPFINPVYNILAAPGTAIIFHDDFEGRLQESWYREMPDTAYSGSISGNYALSGSSSLRIELNKSDPPVNNSKRSGLTLLVENGPLQERTYSFATLLPNGGDEDFALDPEGSEVIAQWHNTPDPGEQWTYPPLALHTYEGHYELWRIWDDAAISTDQQIMDKGQFVRHNLGSYLEDKGRFVQWTFIIKWGWLDSQNPRIQVFKDGAQLLDIKGPNTTNDIKGVKMQIGISKWDWSQGANDTSILTRRVVYYDSVSVK